jgi:hypothetical protein
MRQDKHRLVLAEVAIRWLQHHSALTPGDLGIIIGGSKPVHVETALVDACVFISYYRMKLGAHEWTVRKDLFPTTWWPFWKRRGSM